MQFWNVLGIILYIRCFIQCFLPFLLARHFKFHPPKKWRGFRNLRIVKSVGFSSDSRQGTFQPDRSSRRRMGEQNWSTKKKLWSRLGSLSHHLQGQGLQTCSIENGDGQQKDPTANRRFISMTPTLEESLQQLTFYNLEYPP